MTNDARTVKKTKTPSTQPTAGVKVEPGAPSPDELKTRFGRDIFHDFDYNDRGFNDHMNELLDEQLKYCPVARSETGEGYWWIARHEDVRRVGQDWKTFSSAKGYQPNRLDGMPYIYPVEMDPPQQTAWRNALNPHLAPKVVEGFDAAIRRDANELIDRFIGKGNCEFISEFGVILPGLAFFKNSLGVSVELLADLVYAVEQSLFGPMVERVGQLKRVFILLDQYLKQRSNQPPGNDIVDIVLKGVTYPDGTAATWEQKLGIAADLTLGGVGTTTYVMGSALHYLATHDEDRQRLIDDPEMISTAIEEFVRVFPPVIGVGRYCTRDVEVAGVQMKQGDFALLAYAGASRDPRVVENPQDVDLARQTVVHATFGVGPHRCIGSHLARVVMRVFLEEWLRRIPEFKVKPGTTPAYETSQLRQMTTLQLVW